jgi:methylmalonyl-CoA mutase
LLRLSIEAAKARCTVGEISLALENAFGRHKASNTIVQGAYKAAYSTLSEDSKYDQILRDVKAFEEKEGRRPRILVAKMGQDGHDRGAKVIASGFSDMGFDVDVGPLFSTPEEVVLQALDSDVHVIGISSQAAGHKTLLPALKLELEKRGAEDIVVVAGGVIPPQDYDYLLEDTKSCAAIFGPGTRIVDAARKVLSLIPTGKV